MRIFNNHTEDPGTGKRDSMRLLLFIFLLLIPSLFINLGLSPFILDEATRANVAMEMVFSGNYITPTINGEFYYNKPPLFNWIQILFTGITGCYSEWVFRLPVVLSLLFFALSVYLTQKKEFGRKAALLSALALITCGRILFYDSFRGLIDISFSWIIYLLFWSIFHYYRKRDFYSLFIVSWLFTSLAFLMKGLPALVFQGISLLVFFISKKEFRKLFSLASFSGLFLFLVLAGSYFMVYNSYNSLDNYFNALLTESTKRTFLENPLWSSISHIFIFPFEFIYHFFPWTLFILILFRKGSTGWLWKFDFTRYFILIFVANILIYWLSPAIYARYLFMFVPLLTGLVFHVYFNYRPEEEKISRFFLHPLFMVIAAGIALILILFPFFVEPENFEGFKWKYILSLLILIPVFYFFFRIRKEWPFIMVALLLAARIAFDFFVIPDRIRTGTDEYQKRGAIVAAELSGEKPLYLLGDTRIQHVSTYYISRTKKQILRRWNGAPVVEMLYIVEKDELQELPGSEEIFSFETRLDELKLSLIRVNEE